jgi:hypothetical protein
MGVELLSSCAGFVQLTNRNLINRHMKNDSLEKLIWVLIYGGLLTLGVSFAVPEGSKALGAVLTLAGAAAAGLGAALIVVRSRRK